MSLEPYRDDRLPERFLRWLATLRAQFAPPKFIAPTLLNSWVNYGSGYADAGYYRDPFGRVHLRGLIRDGTATSGTVLFVLPVGYRPSGHVTFPAAGQAIGPADAYARVNVNNDGNVSIIVGTNTWLSLNGISFAAV